MLQKFTPFLLLTILLFGSCKKDETDTSGGVVINPIRELEVFIDGTEWQSDDVFMETIYGGLSIIGNNEDQSKIIFNINEFDGSGTYEIDNATNQFRYWELADEADNYYSAASGSITITEFPSPETNMIGSFELNDVNFVNGTESLEFTDGVFNGIDSLRPIGSEVLDITLNQDPWFAKSVEVAQNNTLGSITVLAQSASDITYVVIRIPLNTTPGTYDISDDNFTVEYQEVDGNTYTALTGEIVITENDIFNSVLSGNFSDLTLTYPTNGATVFLDGSFNFEY